MTRTADYQALNLPGQAFRVYVGFGSEIRIAVDANMQSPPPTFYPENLHMVPFRPTAVLGPHRIGFVGEGLPFYGGYSYGRWRRAALNHSWSGTGSPLVQVREDPIQTYPSGVSENANALFTWDAPGIYEVSLTVYNDEGESHTGKRQVIIYESREEAYDGVVSVSSISGSMEQGGWACQLKAKGDLSFLLNARDLQGYIPVVVYVDQYFETSYGTWERKEPGLNWDAFALDLRDDPRIIFSGYLDKSSIDITHDGSSATFEARGADLLLEQMQTSSWGFFESAYDGSGIVYNDLNTASVILHMLQEHSNWADWHDTHLFYDIYDSADPEDVVDSPQMEYKDWTFTQGMYWSNIRDTAENQFERAWVDQRGLSVMPDRNMWVPDIWYRRADSELVRLPLEQNPVGMIVGTMEDATETSCIPLSIKITERLSQSVSYYKIIASLSYSNEEWGADYPRSTPAAASGKWVLIQGKYYSDDDRDITWNNLWNFAAKGYAAANARYTLVATFGMHMYWRLGDIIEVVYADSHGRVAFTSGSPHRNYFEVEGISYEVNTDQNQWRTSYQLRELTTYTSPTPSIPPTPSPPR